MLMLGDRLCRYHYEIFWHRVAAVGAAVERIFFACFLVRAANCAIEKKTSTFWKIWMSASATVYIYSNSNDDGDDDDNDDVIPMESYEKMFLHSRFIRMLASYIERKKKRNVFVCFCFVFIEIVLQILI